MGDLVGLALAFVFFVVMMGVGFFVGGYRERSHFAKLERRESRLGAVNATQIKTYIAPAPGAPPPTLVTTEVVIASDYLKTFLAGLRKIFGGEIRSYENAVAACTTGSDRPIARTSPHARIQCRLQHPFGFCKLGRN